MTIDQTIRVIAAGLLLGASTVPAAAAEPAPVTFLGTEIKPDPGPFRIIKDRLRVRAKPGRRGRRVGRLRKGDKVRSAGRAAKANWVSVYAEDGKEFGFVYGRATRRLIDGRLEAEIRGRVWGAATCSYVIRFVRRQSVPREFLDTADYDVDFACAQGDDEATFSAFMFITEIDYRISSNQRYQVSVDLPQIAGGYDDILSVTALYCRRDDLLTFHGATLPGFSRTPATGEVPATSVITALKAAVNMAAASWTAKTWAVLMGRMPPPGPTLDQIAPGRESN